MSDSGSENGDESKRMRLGEAMVESLRHMASFSQRSLKYFDETANSEMLHARRLPPVSDMMISRLNFKSDARAEYDKVGVGQMRRVVAATGVGKSTVFPAEICSYTGQNGLILSPRSDLSYFNGAYLSEKFLKQHYPGISAVQLRSEHAKHPAVGKVLYYDSAASFFMMWAIYPTLLRKLNIKFILFDESHEETAEYKLAELLASAGKFNDVKVLQVSATSGDANMEHEVQQGQRRVVSVESELMDLANVDTLPDRSPLHYSKINSRALVFVPELATITAAKRYYETYDIPVYVYTSASSSVGMPQLQDFLADNKVAVILTDRKLDTGFTFQWDDGYDCGYTSELQLDLVQRTVEVLKRPVTLAERMQRGGRIGRLGSGTFYFANVESTPVRSGLSDSSACYLALWCKLYNLSTNLPDIVRFKKYFGEMTHRKTMKLLHCHVHPILAEPYMDMEGRMCHGWERVFNHAIRKTQFEATDTDKHAEIEADWVFQNVYDDRYVDELEQIKVPLSVPEPWIPFFYAVWKVTGSVGQRWPFQEHADRRSVLSVVPLDTVARKKTWFRTKKSRDSSATLNLDPSRLARDVRKAPVLHTTVSPVLEEVTDVDVVAGSFDTGYASRSVAQPAELYKSLPPPPAIPEPSVTTVRLNEPRPRSRSYSVSKLSIKDGKAPVQEVQSPQFAQSLAGYKQVRAAMLHVEKVFPFDVSQLDLYLNSTSRRLLDVQRVDDLCDFKVKVHDLSLDMQEKYVVSIVRCWNYNVVALAQVAARQDRRPSMFRTTSKDVVNLERDLESFKQLMTTMELEGFKFAVKRSGRHSDVARTYPQIVSDRIDFVRGTMRVLKVDGVRRGIYLFDSGCILGLLHVFEVDGKLEYPHVPRVVRIARHDDLVIMGDTMHPSNDIVRLIRQPVSGERVVIITVLQNGDFSVVSDIQVAESAHKWFHTAQGIPGMSGAAIIAEDDGKLVGLHLGDSDVYPAYKSAMVALYGFVTEDA